MRKTKTGSQGVKTPAQEIRERIARRVALEFQDGMYGILLLEFTYQLEFFSLIGISQSRYWDSLSIR